MKRSELRYSVGGWTAKLQTKQLAQGRTNRRCSDLGEDIRPAQLCRSRFSISRGEQSKACRNAREN
jgi:hypothetical protein